MRLLIMSHDGRIVDSCEFAEALTSTGLEVSVLNSSKYCYLSETKPLNILPTPGFLKFIKRFNPDFVLTDSSYYVPQILKLVSRRLLYHMPADPWTELYFDGAMNPSFFKRFHLRYLAAITNWSFKGIDLILPNSMWLEKQVKEHLQNCPTQVLYMGVDPRKWDPNNNKRNIMQFNLEHPAVVGLFPFNQYAKISGLLKLTKAIRKMKDVNFYFAGNGLYLDLVRKQCPSNMFLVGRLSGLQIREFLETGDIFVHPSGLDALPRSVKEAALMEKPIVASAEGGIPEIIRNGQTGYLCDINDPDQWVERIRFLLDNPDVGNRFGKNARKFVKEIFDWKKIAKRLLGIMRDFTEGF